MLKHPDYHFGNSYTEVLTKFICWTLSAAPIFVIWHEMDPQKLNSSLATPILILGISCCSDMFLLQKQRTENIPVIFFGGFSIIFVVICLVYFIICISKKDYPDWILTSTFGVFIFTLVLMAADSIIWFKMDTIPKDKEPTQSELIELFKKALKQEQQQ